MSISDEIKEYGLETGLDDIRITSAATLPVVANEIISRQKEGLIPSDYRWSEEDVRNFCDPSYFVPNARSVIIGSYFYLIDEPGDLSTHDEPHGLIVPYTRRNFYRIVKKKLSGLARHLRKKFPSARFSISSCGFIREKPLAERSGLGWYGNHGIIVTGQWGSWIVLGALVTSLELPPDAPSGMTCGNCSLCVRACPTGALVAPGRVDIRKCLQYLSVKEALPQQYRDLWGKRLYGCIACQEACVRNKKVKPRTGSIVMNETGPSVPLIPLLASSDEEIRARFKGNQMGASWVPPPALRKNALVALGNIGNPVAIPELEKALSSSPDTIREHAAWALFKIRGRSARHLLEKALRNTENEEIRKKIRSYL